MTEASFRNSILSLRLADSFTVFTATCVSPSPLMMSLAIPPTLRPWYSAAPSEAVQVSWGLAQSKMELESVNSNLDDVLNCHGEEGSGLKAKLSTYWSLYVLTLTYGQEFWVMTKRMRSRAQVAEMSSSHRVAGITLIGGDRQNVSQ